MMGPSHYSFPVYCPPTRYNLVFQPADEGKSPRTLGPYGEIEREDACGSSLRADLRIVGYRGRDGNWRILGTDEVFASYEIVEA